MRPCVIIPYYNHPTTIATVAAAALGHCPVVVVDDGSTNRPPELPGCQVVRLDQNRGKGAALRAGFQFAIGEGFTHAITMDADGQHSATDLPKFLAAAEAQPAALLVGVRDFFASGAPAGRRRSNAVSSFWFRVETGVRLPDTQCGFRCYPLTLAQKLRVHSERYAFELEFLVRAAWLGAAVVAVPVACSYLPDQLRQSHFRPVVDLTRITVMNIGLVLQSWFVPQTLRAAWSLGQQKTWWRTMVEFFSENANDPARLASAVGLGLFCGIAPIWGYQMVAAAAMAHFLRLNKAIALLASNISIPPIAPFILYGALALGHWMFTGKNVDLSAHDLTRARALEYAWQWCIGSVVLGAVVGAIGTLTTYCLARLLRNPSRLSKPRLPKPI
jgi:uncharacterized protein (DUF2062 family)